MKSFLFMSLMGKTHKYKPDFIEDRIYVEIKGYFSEQVRAKEKFFRIS